MTVIQLLDHNIPSWERERLLTVGCCSTIFVIIEEMWFDQDLRMKIFQKVTGDNRLVAVLNKIWNVFYVFNVSLPALVGQNCNNNVNSWSRSGLDRPGCSSWRHVLGPRRNNIKMIHDIFPPWISQQDE